MIFPFITHEPAYRYNVQCRPGQLLHYLVTDHILQGPLVDRPTPTCVDFLGENIIKIEEGKNQHSFHSNYLASLLISLGTITG